MVRIQSKIGSVIKDEFSTNMELFHQKVTSVIDINNEKMKQSLQHSESFRFFVSTHATVLTQHYTHRLLHQVGFKYRQTETPKTPTLYPYRV